jgi:hypothetical protein
MRHSRFAWVLVVPLLGCTSSSGILPAGPDTYTVTERLAPVRGGGTEAQRIALTEANTYCQQQNRVFVPVNNGPSRKSQ